MLKNVSVRSECIDVCKFKTFRMQAQKCELQGRHVCASSPVLIRREALWHFRETFITIFIPYSGDAKSS